MVSKTKQNYIRKSWFGIPHRFSIAGSESTQAFWSDTLRFQRVIWAFLGFRNTCSDPRLLAASEFQPKDAPTQLTRQHPTWLTQILCSLSESEIEFFRGAVITSHRPSVWCSRSLKTNYKQELYNLGVWRTARSFDTAWNKKIDEMARTMNTNVPHFFGKMLNLLICWVSIGTIQIVHSLWGHQVNARTFSTNFETNQNFFASSYGIVTKLPSSIQWSKEVLSFVRALE